MQEFGSFTDSGMPASRPSSCFVRRRLPWSLGTGVSDRDGAQHKGYSSQAALLFRPARCQCELAISLAAIAECKAGLITCCVCADPDFAKALYCSFQFERPQRLKAVILSSEGRDNQNLGA